MNSPLKSATLDSVTLNQAIVDQLQDSLENVYPSAPWIAKAVIAHRPFASFEAFKYALTQAVQGAGDEVKHQLTADSEPDWQAWTDSTVQVSDESSFEALLKAPLAQYRTKFGFPFVLAPEGSRGLAIHSGTEGSSGKKACVMCNASQSCD